jgi:Site-specific recombinase XerD
MDTASEFDPTPGDDALEALVQTRLSDLEGGKYRRNTGYVLRRFANYLRGQGLTEPEAITAETLRGYARALRRHAEGGDITASTAQQYWALVSSFLSWSVREGVRDANPAHLTAAQEPLPEADGNRRQQFWSGRERTVVCRAADARVDGTLDADAGERERMTAFRDRALVYTLAYTGCRGAELVRVPDDPKRTGVTWQDVDLDAGTLTVYGKSRTRQEAPIFEPAEGPLERWHGVADPAPNWPVFLTAHLPSLYGVLPDDIEPDHERIYQQLREYDCCPPALTTTSVRRILERLCENSAYEFDEPLKPHGARRALGDQLYREQAELAQDVLRHQDIKTTHAAYREERVQELKSRGDELFESE